jgi:large repetitive protein
MATMTFAEFWAAGETDSFWSRNPVGAQAYLLAMDAVAKTSDEVVLGDIRPTSAEVEGGTAVEVRGSNLTGSTAVTFGGTAGTDVTVVDDNRIRCTAPAKAAGTYDVVVANPKGDATLPDAVTYL